MGGGSSTTQTTNIISRQIAESFVKNIMNCTSSNLVTQSFKIKGNGNIVTGVKMVQNFKLSSDCTQSAQNIAKIQQDLANSIDQVAKTQGVAIFGALGNTSTDQSTYIENEVRSKVTQETIQNIINQTNAQQEFGIEGNENIVKEFTMEQTMELLMSNAQDVINKLDSVQSIENQTKQKGETIQTNPISDIINSVFGGLSSLLDSWIMLILGLVLIGLIVAMIFRKQLMGVACITTPLRFTPLCDKPKEESKPQ